MITALVLILIFAVAAIFAVVWMMGGNKRQANKAAKETQDSQINR